MLKGKTTIELNQATMIAAVQMYLDSTFKESHVVTNVKYNSSGSAYSGNTFTIEIDDGASAAKAAA